MDLHRESNGPSVEARVERLERLLESTMQQVGFLTGVLRDLVESEDEQPEPAVIVPLRRH